MRDCIGFALLRSRKLVLLSQPIKCKTKPITRALGSLVSFTLRSHWLFKVLSFHLIGCCDNFGFGCTKLNRKALYYSNRDFVSRIFPALNLVYM